MGALGQPSTPGPAPGASNLSLLVIQKGGQVGAAALVLAGVAEFASYFSFIPEPLAHGVGLIAMGIIGLSLAQGRKHSDDMFVASEAEKRRQNDNLQTASVVPAIQHEIVRQDIAAGTTKP